MDSINDKERRFCTVIEDATQGSGRNSDELGEVLLSEVLILHELSDSIFHFLGQNYVVKRCFISEQGVFASFSFDFTKVKLKFGLHKLLLKYFVF